VTGAIVPSALGSAAIAAMTFWALPTGSALGEQHVLTLNVLTAVVYGAIAVPAGTIWGLIWLTIPEGADPAVVLRRTLLAAPSRMATIQGTVWLGAAVTFAAINLRTPWLAATVGTPILLGGAVTTAMSYWFCTRALRPSVAKLLTNDPPSRQRGPGLRLRAVSVWLVATGIPILALMLVAASALAVDFSGDRLAWVVIVLGSLTVISGLTAAAFTGATTADPIDEVRRGMQCVERGEYEVTVPVFDASELGLLQAGFNTMASGLRERERLRDLFGRHVGRDVARLAEANATAGTHVAMESVSCEVAVLFIDMVGSTRLASSLPPAELVAVLNEFFAVVVEVVERHGGVINKFEGDASLAIFGAPVPTDDNAGRALAAARELNGRLNAPDAVIRFGIGVSAGIAAAGNVGDPTRYEYTVIGDPVNEAARLTEVAKRAGGVAASGAAVNGAEKSEAARWRIVESQILRGRETATDISVPDG
jgi:adenylate cyclase